jgi:adenine nucleotide transporter 17
VNRFFPHAPTASLNTITELALGALAAAFAQLFTIPVSVIATRQQLSNKSTSFLETLRSILADDGITGLWRGLKPSLVLTINPAITYGMFERLKTAALKEGEKMTPGKAFYLGAMSKTMATVVRPLPPRPTYNGADRMEKQVTYPYIMAKTRLQAKYTDDDTPVALTSSSSSSSSSIAKTKKKERYNGAIDVLTQVYKEKGFGGWYQVRPSSL